MLGLIVYIFAIILAFKAGNRALEGRWSEAGPYAVACCLAIIIAYVASKLLDD